VDPSLWHECAAAAKPSGLALDPSVHTALPHAPIEDPVRCATAAGCRRLEPGLDRMLVADPHYPVPGLHEDEFSALPKDAQLRVDFGPDALAEYCLGRNAVDIPPSVWKA
jgi:hypothetical protein